MKLGRNFETEKTSIMSITTPWQAYFVLEKLHFVLEKLHFVLEKLHFVLVNPILDMTIRSLAFPLF